jgi:hypothetical protein
MSDQSKRREFLGVFPVGNLVSKANERIPIDASELMNVIASNDVVFAVWQDPTEEDGVSMRLVKGEMFLATLAKGKTVEVRCDRAEGAEAKRLVLGDAAKFH